MPEGWRAGYLRYRDLFLNIYQMYIKRKDVKIFLELALTLITLGVFLLFALKPTILTILALTKEIKAKQDTIATLDTKILNLRKAQATINQEQTKINLLENAIPDGPQPASFSRQIEGAAYTNNSTIVGISIAETTLVGEKATIKSSKDKGAFPQEALPLTFSGGFSGNFESLLNVITNTQQTRRPIVIDSLVLSKSKSKEENPDILGLAITGRVPYLLETTK